MFRSESSWQDASGLEQREGASRGVEGGGNERPLVAGMDAQRNPAWDARSVAQVQSCVASRKKNSLAIASVGFPSTIRVSGYMCRSMRSSQLSADRSHCAQAHLSLYAAPLIRLKRSGVERLELRAAVR